MNGSYGAKNHTASQNTAASDKDNGGPRRCSFKEPLPVRPDKNDVNRRSSISMGVAARASLLSAQNSAAGGDGYTAPPDGYNPSPDKSVVSHSRLQAPHIAAADAVPSRKWLTV